MSLALRNMAGALNVSGIRRYFVHGISATL